MRAGLDDLAGLRDAMAGCCGVFWAAGFGRQRGPAAAAGINVVDAAADAGIGHLVLAAASDRWPEAPSPGGPDASVEAYARTLALPCTWVWTAPLYDSILARLAPSLPADGGARLPLPRDGAPLAGIAGEDVGGAVAGIFERREELVGRSVPLAGDVRSVDGYAAALSRARGRPTHGAERCRQAVPASDPRFGEALARTRALHPAVQSFEAWLRKRCVGGEMEQVG